MILELLLFHKIGKWLDIYGMTVMLIFLDRFGFGSRDQQVNIGHRSAIFSMRHALLSMVSMLCYVNFMAAGPSLGENLRTLKPYP